MAGVWVVWLPLGWSLDWYVASARVVGFLVLFPCCFCPVGRVSVCFSSVRGVTWFLFSWFACRPVGGV